MFRSFFKSLSIITLEIFLAIILSGIFIYKSEFSMALYGDTSKLLPQNILALLLGLTASGTLFWLFWVGAKKIKFLNSRIVRISILAVYALFEVAVIYFFKIKLTADWEVLYRVSAELLNGNVAALNKGGYLFAYPNNLGVAYYFVLLNKLFPGNIYIPRLVNVVTSIVTIILLNKTLLTLSSKYTKNKNRFFLMTVLFLPGIFMSNLVYNEVVSTTFFLAGVCSILIFAENKKTKYLFAAILLFSLGNFFRSIGVLFVLATLFYFFLKKLHIKTFLVFIILIIVGFSIPRFTVNYVYGSKGKIAEPLGKNSAPLTKWLNIGLTKEYFGYWDRGVSYAIYANIAKENKKRANSLFIKELKNKMNNYHLGGISKIYYKKTVWLWTEGTYQSVYLGMSNSYPGGYIVQTPVNKYFDSAPTHRDIFKIPMYFTNIISFLIIFSYLGLAVSKKEWNFLNSEETYLILIFLAFLFFYLLWEVKPRYIYPVFPYILLLTYVSATKLEKMLKAKKRR